MNFQNNPFVQAKDEVAKKSFGTRIYHSDSLHVLHSAFSSKGSAWSLGCSLAAKGASAGLGKIPFVGGLLGLALVWASEKKRDAHHQDRLDTAVNKGDNENELKFLIKSLTIEKLDRYRFKVNKAFEELNDGVDRLNKSAWTCDDIYNIALLMEQAERRRDRLQSELCQYQRVIDCYLKWDQELEKSFETVNKRRNEILQKIVERSETVVAHKGRKESVIEVSRPHSACKRWCYCKYDGCSGAMNWVSVVRRAEAVKYELSKKN